MEALDDTSFEQVGQMNLTASLNLPAESLGPDAETHLAQYLSANTDGSHDYEQRASTTMFNGEEVFCLTVETK